MLESVIIFKLKALLEKYGISSYKFERSVEGFAPVTIKKIVSGEHNPSFESLNEIMKSLHKMDIKVQLSDLLEYIPDTSKKSKT
jgi:DNA-binding Xre family transcriptional regulator